MIKIFLQVIIGLSLMSMTFADTTMQAFCNKNVITSFDLAKAITKKQKQNFCRCWSDGIEKIRKNSSDPDKFIAETKKFYLEEGDYSSQSAQIAELEVTEECLKKAEITIRPYEPKL